MDEKTTMPSILQQCLCMKIVLQPMHPDSHEYHIVIGPDGNHDSLDCQP